MNIVRLVDVHSDPLHYYIVLELLTGQELLARLRKMERFTESEAADIMRQLVSAVRFLHEKRIVHRDLKPEVLSDGIVNRHLYRIFCLNPRSQMQNLDWWISDLLVCCRLLVSS